ncbi:MAG: hypothetical protein IPL26_08555 [Leptospiraceae bacterium]|nr:hypothetical protein [Leptospiraceae bacterium]
MKNRIISKFPFSLEIWLLIIYSLFITTLYAKIQTQPRVKSDVAPQKKTKCCSIQRTFKNKINITEICVENGITKIELQVIIPYTMCSNLTDVGLSDERGKSYKIVGMQNIPTCPTILQVEKGHKFYWNFETLDKGITSLDLTENKNSNLAPTFPNWEFWYWKDINVGHCKF